MKKIIVGMFAVFALLFVVGCSQSPTSKVVDVPIDQVQIIEVGLTRQGYTPSVITVNVNRPVTLKNDGTLGGCGMYLNQPEIGMSANFVNNDTYTFTPKIKGTFIYTCSMGMFKGTIKVIW